MEIFNASSADSLFSAMLTQSSGLENLANAALQRGIDAYTKQDYTTAVKEFKRSVGIGRGSSFAADAAQYLAMSYLQLGDTENAIKAYKSAFQIDPYRDDIHVQLGNLYFSQGKYEDARGEYAEAVRLNPSTVNRYSLGQAYIELERVCRGGAVESQHGEPLFARPGIHRVGALFRCRDPVQRDPAPGASAGRWVSGNGTGL
ncbi:MAG: hypothetical protein H6Q04_1980 [Acidobacteria bacterium]|nr:hypothetical protein [Acidobacteriota bacterium]